MDLAQSKCLKHVPEREGRDRFILLLGKETEVFRSMMNSRWIFIKNSILIPAQDSNILLQMYFTQCHVF